MVVCGLVFAVAIQRHLINGVGCFSAGLFFEWVALVVIALPLMIYAWSRSIFTESAANEDCASSRSSHEFENDRACRASGRCSWAAASSSASS